MVAHGVGAAMAGMHPIVDLNFVDFSFGAMDEIANQAAKIPFMLGRPVPLVIRATAGVAHGGPQHNNSLESYFMNLPGVNLVVPAFPIRRERSREDGATHSRAGDFPDAQTADRYQGPGRWPR